MAELKSHTVAPGQHLYWICWKAGMARPSAVWNSVFNVHLQVNRKTPNLLVPGDIVLVPPRELQTESGKQDNKRHPFKGRNGLFLLRLRILHPDLKTPMSDTKYELDFPEFPSKSQSKCTKSDGTIEFLLHPLTTRATLTVFGPQVLRYELRIGDLTPLTDVDQGPNTFGVWQRLRNLGFVDDESDTRSTHFTVDESRLGKLVQRFHRRTDPPKEGQSPSGANDEALRAKVGSVHGC